VSVRTVGEGGEPSLLILEKYPEVQGGAIVIQNGKIKSIAGGSENRFFNRAIHAKRTMGSAFKPLVYTAALQLGWNSVDPLRNKRDLFIYHGKAYFPRPDHVSPHDWVSMSWAGVHSENVASVWLLSKLCDQLSAAEFREVAAQIGLAPRVVDGEQEPYRSYRTRIRDKYGIHVNKAALKEAAYHQAVDNLETDFIFDDMVDEYKMLKELHYGRGYNTFRDNIKAAIASEKKKKKVSDRTVQELYFRRSLLKNSYLILEDLNLELTHFRSQIDTIVDHPFPDSTRIMPIESGAALYVDQLTNEFFFMPVKADVEGLVQIHVSDLLNYLGPQGMYQRNLFWEQVKLNKFVTSVAFDKTKVQVEHEYQKLLNSLPYDINVLAKVDDFRITVGLFYLKKLSKELGINSKLEPVLSFPLGSNVITLLEATRMYEGLVSGAVITFSEGVEQDEDNDALAIIDRIEASDGRVLYQPHGREKTIVDKKTSLALGGILENIVKFGTGRAAKKIVKFNPTQSNAATENTEDSIEDLDLSVPLLGKTGTANRYTNASFLGYLPEVAHDGVAMTLTGGYAIGVYVGFDNNTPMRRKTSRISGSAGALPTWSSIANALMVEQDYSSKLDPVDLSFYGLAIKRPALGQVNVGVDAESGGLVVEPYMSVRELSRDTPAILTFGKKSSAGRFVLERNYEPYWKMTGQTIQ